MVVFALVAALLAYIFYDVNYLLRMAATLSLRYFMARRDIFDKYTSYSVCTTTDFGVTFDHMNNAKYHRELDFGRINFYYRTGIFDNIKKHKGSSMVLGASCVRFRKKIEFLSPYKIESQVIYCDQKALYQAHRFITLRDNFVRAVFLTQEIIIGFEADKVVEELTGRSAKMNCPKEIKMWMDAVEEVSAKLRHKGT